MAVSQNGYKANDRSLIDYYKVPGSSTGFNLRKGSVARVLVYAMQEFDDRVEDLDKVGSYVEGDNPPAIPGGSGSVLMDDWSFAVRLVRGGTSLSNHSSGTAVDANSTQHPLGRVGTFTSSQVSTIEDILHDLVDPVTKESVVRWGGHYNGRKDEMHFEIVGSPDAVARVADLIETDDNGRLVIEKKAAPKPPAFPLPSGHYFGVESSDEACHSGYYKSDQDEITVWQRRMRRRGWDIGVDGVFGKQSEEVARKFQDEKGLTADGKVGRQTWNAAWATRVTP